MKRVLLTIRVSALVVLLAGVAGAAEGEADKTLSPYFFVENGDPTTDQLPLKETHADVRIAGVIADVVVTQVYRNEGSRPINARYIFPASTRAAVHGMTLTVGNQRVRAQIKEREVAQRQFDQAQKEGKSAALLEQQRPNVFSMHLANVMPRDVIEVELHYSELLVPTDGTYEFVYPTVVGPRYSSESEQTAPENDSWVKAPYQHEGQAPLYTFDIQTHVAAGMPLQELSCTSHQVTVEWEDANTALVKLDPSETAGGNRDYILHYRLEGAQVESGLLLYQGKEENFFLLMMQPPSRVTPAQIPPREYIFVLDVSGSMHGFPLDTAKTVMRELIGGLRPTDRFNVLLFSGASQLFSPQSLPATPDNVQQAMTTVDHQQGCGETELGAALQRAFDLPAESGMSRTTIVVTDGYVSAESSVFEIIRTNLHRSNVFAFGIGSAVNRFLIEGMGKAGQGEPFVVTKADEAAAAAARFQAYVQAPVLTDVEMASEGFATYDVEPPAIPDLFADRPLVIFGKWHGEPTGTLRIRGSNGADVIEQVFHVAGAEPSEDNRALKYLWARARVARLGDAGLPSDDKRGEIIDLGLTYELLTEYTSFIAVHEVVRNPGGDGQNVDQPLPLPEGVSDLAVGRPVPEPELFVLLALLLVGLVVRQRWAGLKGKPSGNAWRLPSPLPLPKETVDFLASTSFETLPREGSSSGRMEKFCRFSPSTARAEEAPSSQGPSRSPRSSLSTPPRAGEGNSDTPPLPSIGRGGRG